MVNSVSGEPQTIPIQSQIHPHLCRKSLSPPKETPNLPSHDFAMRLIFPLFFFIVSPFRNFYKAIAMTFIKQ